MRIGFFADMYAPHISGVTNHISLYKRRFESLGHDVFVFTFGDLDYADTESNVVRSPGIPWADTGWRFALTLSPERPAALAETLDVIHVHHPFQSGRLAAPIAKRSGNPARVHEPHALRPVLRRIRDVCAPRGALRVPARAASSASSSAATSWSRPPPRIAEWLREFTGFDGATVVPERRRHERLRAPERSGVAAPSSASPPTTSSSATPDASAPRRTPRGSPRSSPRRRLARRARGCWSSATARRAPRPRPRIARAGHERARPVHRHGALRPCSRLRSGGRRVRDRFCERGAPTRRARGDGRGTSRRCGELTRHLRHGRGRRKTGLLATTAEPGALAERIALLATDDDLRERMSAAAREASAAYALERTADVLLDGTTSSSRPEPLR